MRRKALALAPLAAVLLLAACGTSTNTSSSTSPSASGSASPSATCTKDPLTTFAPGKLTVATGEPAFSPWVEDDKPESGKGFEAAVAYAVAKQLGYAAADVAWVRTTFDGAIAPGPKKFDFNIQQYTITDDRKKAVDFSSGYYDVTQAVVQLQGQPHRRRDDRGRPQGRQARRRGRHHLAQGDQRPDPARPPRRRSSTTTPPLSPR